MTRLIANLASLSVPLLISGWVALTPLAVGAVDQTGPRQSGSGLQLAERMIVCGPRRGCRALREGCRLVLAAHPRNNRIICAPARAA